MEAIQQEEERNKRVAMIVSVVAHAILLLLLVFIMAWRAPDPPLPEFGIEVNFGMDAAGSGNVQTKAAANNSKNTEDSPPPAKAQPTPPQEETTPPPTPKEAPVAEKVVTTPMESPVSVKEEKTKPKETEPKKEDTKEAESKPKVNNSALMSKSPGTGTAGTSNNATGNNNGDDANAVGDKGDPKGSVDAKALYGKPGGGKGGSSLDMPGWRWDKIPKPDDESSETGKITFEIKIDEDGEILSVRKVEGTVSAAVERLYRAEVEKTTFSRTGPKPPGYSGTTTGRITFVIRAE